MKRVLASTLEYPGDGFYYLDDEPFTGVAVSYSKDGWEKSYIEYRHGRGGDIPFDRKYLASPG